MNKRSMLGLALTLCSAFLLVAGSSLSAQGSAAILKPHATEPLPAATSAQKGDQAAVAGPRPATKVRKTPVVRAKALKARGKIVDIAPRGKTSGFDKVTLRLKNGERLRIEVAKAMVASRGLKVGETVNVSYKVDRGRKLATRIAS